MSKTKAFDIRKARRITPAEVESARKAIASKLGVKRARRGRPPKAKGEHTLGIYIRLSPEVIAWAKREAKKKGLGYQTVISRALQQLAG